MKNRKQPNLHPILLTETEKTKTGNDFITDFRCCVHEWKFWNLEKMVAFFKFPALPQVFLNGPEDIFRRIPLSIQLLLKTIS